MYTQLLLWATDEMDRQLETLKTCSVCESETRRGELWCTCWNCGRPVCDRCAVQASDGHFCPTCPHETPF